MTKSEPQVRDGRFELSEVPETGSAWSSARLPDVRNSGESGHQQSLATPAIEAASDGTTAGLEQSLAAPAMASASDGTTTRWPAARELLGGRSVLLLM